MLKSFSAAGFDPVGRSGGRGQKERSGVAAAWLASVQTRPPIE